MQQFKLKEDGFKEVRKKILLRTIPLVFVSILCGLAVSYYTAVPGRDNTSGLGLFLPIILVAVFIGVNTAIKHQKDMYHSYKLTIDDTGIRREQNNTPELRISRDEIREIIRNRDGSLAIKGTSRLNAIHIPVQVEGMDNLEPLLAEIKPILQKDGDLSYEKYSIPLALLTVSMFLTVYLASSKILVAIAGSLLMISMGYGLYVLLQSKNVNEKSKKFAWLILLPMVSFLSMIIRKLME